jgi:hypothetical protein
MKKALLHKVRVAAGSVLLLAALLAACSPPAGPSLVETATPNMPPEPTATTVVLTATPSPVPATNTPAPTRTQTPTATSTPPPQDYGPDNFPDEINPLTGLPVSDPALLERRPLSVKVQMYPRGQRPDSGISLADIVFDYYQNNGLTRLNAIFYGNDAEEVGPIRSGRLLDAILTRLYKSVFAFGGADRRIYSVLAGSEFSDRLVIEGSNNCPPMCRVDPNGFNHLITNTEELSKYITDKDVSNGRQELNGMSFQIDPPDGGEAGTELSTRYSISAYSRWEYDPDANRYLRFQDNREAATAQEEEYIAFTDALTGEQIAADNVVVLKIPHAFFFRSGNSEIIEIKLAGKGPAYAFRDGQVYEVTWNVTPNSVLFLTNADGTPFPYKHGNTWYQVIGQSSLMEGPEAGAWRFESRIP